MLALQIAYLVVMSSVVATVGTMAIRLTLHPTAAQQPEED
jgi:hypothetical protein